MAMEDDDIRTLVTRLSRPHRSGGRVIERAAILADGADSTAVISWIESNGGVSEDAVAAKAKGGLHTARTNTSDLSRPATPLRYVVPATALSADA